ncbi:hypothetical protein PNOK_0794700 [Pyrrhoderma noxium]|uniref:Uncharacterized protein n=1 Tax=Pyrrhoderma noxium TaxID=2282107 RepID=A0A286U9S9_9AGAM|nr:hypothetical protein PNOK_0794700 [Pyrrhoderma noxium]
MCTHPRTSTYVSRYNLKQVVLLRAFKQHAYPSLKTAHPRSEFAQNREGCPKWHKAPNSDMHSDPNTLRYNVPRTSHRSIPFDRVCERKSKIHTPQVELSYYKL